MRPLAFGPGPGHDPSGNRPSDPRSAANPSAFYAQLTIFSTGTASAMIAQQVAGKAIRDALFLSTFNVKTLPAMMAGGAVASLVGIITISRLLARRSPSDVLPFLFGVNALAVAAAYVAFFRAPHISALVVYLAMAVLGPVILSTFWSVINEHFDPQRAKSAVARVTAGATLGGVIGGLATWALSRQLTLASAIGFLGLLNAACVGGALALRRIAARTDRAAELANARASAPPSSTAPMLAPLTKLRDMPFLRALAALTALGSASSTLLDYTFSAKAMHMLGTGPALLAFFSLFGIAVSLLSFIVQIAIGKVAIERLGLMVNVAALQILVVGGSALALLAPSMRSVTLLRGAEMVHRNSLFKSAYELFYTPIPDAQRRVTKAIIDVGFDRIGTVLGSGVTAVVLWRSRHEEVRLLWVVALIALVCLPLAKWLHAGYVETLAQGLREAAPRIVAAGPKPENAEHEVLIERIEAVRHPEDRTNTTTTVRDNADEIADRARTLLCGEPDEIRRALAGWEPHHAVLVPLAAPHLADDALRGPTQAAIRSVAQHAIGALSDIILDAKVSFAVRRRVGPILATCRTQRSADGLIAALSDERLEVRYAAGRALLTMTATPEHGIVIPQELVIRLVGDELARVEEASDDAKDDDKDDDDDQSSLLDAIERMRVTRRLEHVFNILALAMDREPLRLAFRAIHHPNERHRGTALEYIQTVLPQEVRDLLWPMIAPGQELLPAPREAAAVLGELGRLLDEPRAPAT